MRIFLDARVIGLSYVVTAMVFGAVAQVAPAAQVAPPAQSATPSQLLERESDARGKAAKEIVALARFAASVGAIHEARSAFATALALTPKDESIASELDKLNGKKQKPTKDGLGKVAERRKKAFAAAVDAMTPIADAYADADRSDELARVVALLRVHGMPVDAWIAKYDLVFFAPYLDWRRKKDLERLTAGWEIVDGEWCDPAKIASLDAAHSKWENAWSVGDGVHEVRTILPLRTARSVLAMVGSYRCFVLEYFAGEWDLRPPAAKLPVILATSQAELEQRVEEVTHSHQEMGGVAFTYLNREGVGNPCFARVVSEKDANGTSTVDLSQVRTMLLHEITHQILYEYSEFASAAREGDRFDPWLTEGIAAFLPSYVLVDGVWTLKHSRGFTFRDGFFLESAFAWCQAHVDQLPAIKDLVALTLPRWVTKENAYASTMLAAFLLEGRDREHRAEFCALASLVHQSHETADSFAACFKGVDLVALDKQFKAYCKEVKLDEK